MMEPHAMALLRCVISDAPGRFFYFFLPTALFVRAPPGNSFFLSRLKLCAAEAVCLGVRCVSGPLRLSRPLFDSTLSLGKRNGLILKSGHYSD